jgi:hypothetical protein
VIAALGGLALSIAVACGTGKDATARQQVSGAERALVANAVEALRKALNAGTCESILDPAVAPARSQDWIERCNHVRDAWGSWQAFHANYWYRSGDTAIAVEGIAEFTKGNCVVQVVWNLRCEPARIMAFFLSSERDRVSFPSLPSPYFDPPQKRVRTIG